MASIKDLWKEYIVEVPNPRLEGMITVCGLCGNTGIVDTHASAQTPYGVKAGIRTYCICPNGRVDKKHKINIC